MASTRRWFGARDFYLLLDAFLAILAMGVIGIYGASSPEDGWKVFALAGVMGGASFFLIGLVGYLFGIPRYAADPTTISSGNEPLYRANANLEQISDWLTKIIVGAGLVQIGAIAGFVSDLGDSAAEALPELGGAKQLFVSLVLLEACCGFIFLDLWSRLYMPELFRKAEARAMDVHSPSSGAASVVVTMPVGSDGTVRAGAISEPAPPSP
jgi:hypothetical protein